MSGLEIRFELEAIKLDPDPFVEGSAENSVRFGQTLEFSRSDIAPFHDGGPIATAAALLALAREHNIEMPITEQVNAILYEGTGPAAAIREIMERPQKSE